MDLKGVKYLLSFEPFGTLPEKVKKAYLNGSIHLLPFPGSLLFWGVPGYRQMQSELFMSNQISLLNLVERHEAPYGLRVPQSGWIHIPSPSNPSPHEDFGPLRSTFQRTHRGTKVDRHEDELALPGRLDHILHVLFSTDSDDLELYGNQWPVTVRFGHRTTSCCSTARRQRKQKSGLRCKQSSKAAYWIPISVSTADY